MQQDNSSSFGKSVCNKAGASYSANHQTMIDRYYKGPGSSSNAPFDVNLARNRAQAEPRVDVMLERVAKE